MGTSGRCVNNKYLTSSSTPNLQTSPKSAPIRTGPSTNGGEKIAPVMQRPLHVRHRPDSGPPFFIRKAIMTLGMAMGIREFLGISKKYVSIGRLVAVFFGEGIFYSTFLYRFCFYLCKVCYSCKKGNPSWLGSYLGHEGHLGQSTDQHISIWLWLDMMCGFEFQCHKIHNPYDLPATNKSPLKIGPNPKGKSSLNHHFSGAMLVSRRVSLTISRWEWLGVITSFPW